MKNKDTKKYLGNDDDHNDQYIDIYCHNTTSTMKTKPRIGIYNKKYTINTTAMMSTVLLLIIIITMFATICIATDVDVSTAAADHHDSSITPAVAATDTTTFNNVDDTPPSSTAETDAFEADKIAAISKSSTHDDTHHRHRLSLVDPKKTNFMLAIGRRVEQAGHILRKFGRDTSASTVDPIVTSVVDKGNRRLLTSKNDKNGNSNKRAKNNNKNLQNELAQCREDLDQCHQDVKDLNFTTSMFVQMGEGCSIKKINETAYQLYVKFMNVDTWVFTDRPVKHEETKSTEDFINDFKDTFGNVYPNAAVTFDDDTIDSGTDVPLVSFFLDAAALLLQDEDIFDANIPIVYTVEQSDEQAKFASLESYMKEGEDTSAEYRSCSLFVDSTKEDSTCTYTSGATTCPSTLGQSCTASDALKKIANLCDEVPQVYDLRKEGGDFVYSLSIRSYTDYALGIAKRVSAALSTFDQHDGGTKIKIGSIDRIECNTVHFENGDICQATGKPRRGVIKFVEDCSTNGLFNVGCVVEDPTCVYTVTVRGLCCDHTWIDFAQ